ncbi:UNVERIFIED_CONTAM: hypothetical protein Slati_1462600 [Sesamum latifolium]|uniref:Uncharacterized protein n=1 Tax=Sesamum latifolium TaxID=2727402 RepID=A0AAW2X4V8_9LAMI
MPQEFYPLPRINQLVDSTSACELLSMMDASQGYHPIMLAPEDRKRVSITTSAGTFCYVAMPFELKNAGDLEEMFSVLRKYRLKLNSVNVRLEYEEAVSLVHGYSKRD